MEREISKNNLYILIVLDLKYIFNLLSHSIIISLV